jgi:hypothetical protein
MVCNYKKILTELVGERNFPANINCMYFCKTVCVPLSHGQLRWRGHKLLAVTHAVQDEG